MLDARILEALEIHKPKIPDAGQKFGLIINQSYQGWVICHAPVRNVVRRETDVILSIVPRSVEFLNVPQSRKFIDWILNDPFFENFFLIKDTDWVVQNRTFVMAPAERYDRWYVCAMFLRSFWQGFHILDCWSRIMTARPHLDPLVVLASLMITRPAYDEKTDLFCVLKDRGIANGHMPFPYDTGEHPEGSSVDERCLRAVRARGNYPRNCASLWELLSSRNGTPTINTFFAGQQVETLGRSCFSSNPLEKLKSQPKSFAEATEEYKPPEWAALIRKIKKVSKKTDSGRFLNLSLLEEISRG
jgi:hypothetical protein